MQQAKLFMDEASFHAFMDAPFDRDRQPLEYYFEQFQPLVKAVANQYQGLASQSDLGFDDLIQIGNIALWRAYVKFDPSARRRKRGSGTIGHFFSYARQTIQRSIERAVFNAVGLPSGYRANDPRFEGVQRVIQASLDDFTETGSVSPMELIDNETPENLVIKIEEREERLDLIRKVLHTLDDDERFIVELVLGLDCDPVDPKQLPQIVRERFGRQHVRIKPKLKSAIRKLQTALNLNNEQHKES